MKKLIPLLILTWTIAFSASVSGQTTPDNLITEPPTFESLGFRWEISGDANRKLLTKVCSKMLTLTLL